MDLQTLRTEYNNSPLSSQGLDPNPMGQFQHWLAQAIETQLPEPNAFILSTVTAENTPNARAILLKEMTPEGFIFYTHMESTKGRELAQNSSVHLLFLWLPLDRQVRITGRVTQLEASRTQKYFQTRPREAQINTWASCQSAPLKSREGLEEVRERYRKEFADKEVPLPPFWGGYLVNPTSFEFWQGCQNRLHDRFLYTKSKEQPVWQVVRLSP